MPGRRGSVWRYLTTPKEYRVINAAVSDTNTPAGVEAIEEIVDRSAVEAGYDSIISLYAMAETTVTAYDLAVFINALPDDNEDVGDERWCLVYLEEGIQGSILTTIPDIPPGKIKVAVFNGAGTGEVAIYTQHSE